MSNDNKKYFIGISILAKAIFYYSDYVDKEKHNQNERHVLKVEIANVRDLLSAMKYCCQCKG